MITGPWRATRLWNELVRSFHSGMPRRRHRRGVTKSAEDCFSGSEAADWMHKRMRGDPNFGPDVSREQTVMLLSKMLRAGILVPAMEEEAEGDARDKFTSSGLYRRV